ncbi:hypothetical protein K7W42_12870 [Deinococcus sp. HMF7604]|uniref:hypothetical protein n=1 Tax=Deinococcus betulae TaxID=2873312 RepID=UPI001CCEBFCB|nr:hypothetical protein [Deinococcus betulae]MBZ9751726.1 hypothetical protein [Deinococcus betulae]MBZ9751749.1 hypothetical protein [Deinococcus betulae]
MNGIVYQVQGGQLTQMREERYDSEAILQDLLSAHPALLAGEQIDAGSPRRWLLIEAEIAVPDQLDGVGRWALDHLFLDQDARPTLIEVKRSTDTRIRREVIGQMLDYAAHASRYWPGSRLRAAFEGRCAAQGLDPVQEVQSIWDGDVETFWARAEENLSEGRLRLLFVADLIPPELRRVIEFLNGAFAQIEVLGVEVRQFRGGGAQVLVPQVVGQSVRAQDRKPGLTASSKPGEVWTQARLAAQLTERGELVGLTLMHRLLDVAAARQVEVKWGRGQKMGSVQLRHPASSQSLMYLYSDGTLSLNKSVIPAIPPFDQPARCRELLEVFRQLEDPARAGDRKNEWEVRFSALHPASPQALERVMTLLLDSLDSAEALPEAGPQMP